MIVRPIGDQYLVGIESCQDVALIISALNDTESSQVRTTATFLTHIFNGRRRLTRNIRCIAGITFDDRYIRRGIGYRELPFDESGLVVNALESYFMNLHDRYAGITSGAEPLYSFEQEHYERITQILCGTIEPRDLAPEL